MGKYFMEPLVPDEISVFIGQVKELVEAHLDPISLQVERMEMFLRDVRLYRIFEGTSEIQRILIARNLLKE